MVEGKERPFSPFLRTRPFGLGGLEVEKVKEVEGEKVSRLGWVGNRNVDLYLTDPKGGWDAGEKNVLIREKIWRECWRSRSAGGCVPVALPIQRHLRVRSTLKDGENLAYRGD